MSRPRSGRCQRFAEARSAFVDESIDPDTRDQLLAHLTDCSFCRTDVAELRRLRRLLGTDTSATGAPRELQHRLVAIAAGQEQDPLWTRPFRRVPGSRLPSRRRRRRRRIASTVLVLGSVLAAAAGVGYAAAPAQAAALDDPGPSSRAEFAAVLADQPLGSDPVVAAMTVGDQLPVTPMASAGLTTATRSGDPASVPATEVDASGVLRAAALPTGSGLDSDASADLLRRSETSTGRQGLTGVERVVVADGDDLLQARISVETVAGQGSEFSVTDDTGRRLGAGFVPVGKSASGAGADHDDLSDRLISSGYQLRGSGELTMLGRRVSVVEARPPGSATPSARWWIDERTGTLLGRQTFDVAGALVQSAAFSSLTPTGGGFIEHPSPRLTVSTASATMAPSGGSQLGGQGWTCPDRLAGLAMTAIRADSGSDPDVVQLIYGDGVWSVSVFERRGRLAAAPEGSRLDRGLDAYVRDGLPRMATWQSGDTVFTAVTDGPASTLESAVRSLPHDRVDQPTTMKRIAAGWTRILQLTFG